MHIFVLTNEQTDLKQILPAMPQELSIHRVEKHPEFMSRQDLLWTGVQLLKELPGSFNVLERVLIVMEATPHTLAIYTLLNMAFTSMNIFPDLLVLNETKTMYLEFSRERAEAIDWVTRHFRQQSELAAISKLENSND